MQPTTLPSQTTHPHPRPPPASQTPPRHRRSGHICVQTSNRSSAWALDRCANAAYGVASDISASEGPETQSGSLALHPGRIDVDLDSGLVPGRLCTQVGVSADTAGQQSSENRLVCNCSWFCRMGAQRHGCRPPHSAP